MLKSINRDQKFLLAILCLINFVNYIDRQVIFPLFGHIKAEFHVSDFQLGLLGTMFMLTHSILSLPLGMLADTKNRKAVISGGVAFWSIMTFASGLVGSFKQLLAVRSLVGIGEASYAPAATAMISDNFNPEVRARAQGFFNIGMFVGGTLGAMLGGVIAYYFGDWRIAFFLVSIPGFMLAFLCGKIVDKVRRHQEYKVSLSELLKNRALVWIIISGIFVTFAGGAYVSWGVEFFHRYKGYNLRDASLVLGSTMMAAGVVGVLAGSWLADHFQKHAAWGRSAVVAVSLMISAPLIYMGIGNVSSRIVLLALFFTGTAFLSFYHGPVAAVIHDVVPDHMRATATAVYILVIHLLGDTLAPAAVGRISDRYGLQAGLHAVTWLVFLSGLAFLMVCRVISNDKRIINNTAIVEGSIGQSHESLI